MNIKCIKLLFLFFLPLMILSCSKPSPFTRANATREIERLCKQKFDLEVIAKDSGQTLWVYVPLDHINDDGSWKITDQGFWEKEIEEKIHNVTYVLHKVLFSLKDPPRFYCLINSNTEITGMDQYNLAFIEKEIMHIMERELLDDVASKSRGSVRFRIDSPMALGDKKGNHIYTYDLCLNEFIAMIIIQKIEQGLRSDFDGESPKIKNLDLLYQGKELLVSFGADESSVKSLNTPLIKLIRDSCEEVLKNYSHFIVDTKVKVLNLSTDQVVSFKVTGKRNIEPSDQCQQAKSSPTLLNIQKANLYYKIARDYYHDQEYILTEEFLKKSIKVLKNFSPSLKLLSTVYNSTAQYNKAQNLNQEYLKEFPRDIGAYIRLGESLNHQNKFEESLLILEEALGVDQDNPGILILLADSYRGLGDYEKALLSYNKLEEIPLSRSEQINLLKKLGNLHLLAGQPSLASDYFDELLNMLDSEDEKVKVHMEIAKGYLLMQKYGLAKVSYKKALNLSKDPDPEIFYNLGFCLQNLQDFEESISNFKKAIEIDPEFYQAYFGLGYCYFNIKDFKNSLIFYKQGLMRETDISAVHVQLGIVYSKLNQYTQALSAFDDAIRLNPDDHLAFYNQGWAYNELLQYEKAEKSFLKALEVDPSLANAYHGLGISLLKQKKYELAEKNLKIARDLFFKEDNFKAIEIIDRQLKTLP